MDPGQIKPIDLSQAIEEAGKTSAARNGDPSLVTKVGQEQLRRLSVDPLFLLKGAPLLKAKAKFLEINDAAKGRFIEKKIEEELYFSDLFTPLQQFWYYYFT